MQPEEFWERIIDSGDGDYSYAYAQAIKAGLSDEEAAEAGQKAGDEVVAEIEIKYLNAIESAADKYFGEHHMELKPTKNYSFKVVSKDWDKAANEIRQTINGVGYFHFNSLKEFKDSIPVRSSRAVALEHLQHIVRWGDVYGESSPKDLVDRSMRY